jgi:alpha-beta hydrolase superfamily lysophospholipase
MTQPKRFQFESTDGLSIACVKWVRPQKVRGVIQIAHGLGEHMGRYAQLAEILLEDEFAVYGNDHRGHGLTAKPSGSFGEFGPGGFDQLVEDMISLRVIAKDEHPRKPYILLRSSLFSTIVIQLVVWRFPVLAFWMAWRASLNRCLQERTR